AGEGLGLPLAFRGERQVRRGRVPVRLAPLGLAMADQDYGSHRPMMLRHMVLVLWDVDRTLIDAAGVGVAAFVTAFRRLYGRELDGMPVMAGRTDLAITLDAFRAHGLPETGLEAFREATEVAFAELDAELRAQGRALPGAAAALAALRAAAAVQTLLTGNIKALA